jgi:hypothetical protein
VACLDAEDLRRQAAAPRRYLTEAQRRAGRLRAVCRDLEDALRDHWSDGVEPWVLARDLDLPEEVIVTFLHRAQLRPAGAMRRVPRTRLLATRTQATTWAAQRPSIALDEGVHWARNGNPQRTRTCPVCHCVFEPARADQKCCSPRCRRVKHRLDREDPTAAATVAWLRDPPPCEGCGEPLAGMRVGAPFHGDACRKRARRATESATSLHAGAKSPTSPSGSAQRASATPDEGVYCHGHREAPAP